jgi:hypothetical protein
MFDAFDRIKVVMSWIGVLFLTILVVPAVGPRVWESATQEELLKGRLHNVSLSSEGRLFLAP